MQKKLFYEDTDAKFKFLDGKVINFDKKLLCWQSKSPIFYQICFGPLNEDTIEIKDFDHETFEVFLNCVMGFSKLTRENAGEIFPVACKYLMTEFIGNCVSKLRPVEMNEDVCHLLNMAFFYNQPSLRDIVLGFILNEGSCYGLLENEKFLYLLSLDSFSELIKWVEFDSCVINAIICWCSHFLKTCNRSESIKELLYELGLIKHFKITLFESGNLLYEFIDGKFGENNLFSHSEICKYFIDSSDSVGKKCKWLKKSKGEFFTEEYDLNEFPSRNCISIDLKLGKYVTYFSPEIEFSCTITKYNLNQQGVLDSKFGIFDSKTKVLCFSLIDWYNSYRRQGGSCKFEIKYNFQQDLRILVTNIKPKLVRSSELRQNCYTNKFYFTENIFIPC